MELEIGLKIGRLEIIGRAYNYKQKGGYTAKCECGTILKAFTKNDLNSKIKNLEKGKIIACKNCTNSEYIKERTDLQKYRYIYNSYKKSANVRNHEFDIDRTLFTNLILSPCTYCGLEKTNERIDRVNPSETIQYNGIDRVDNSKGYIISNVVSCCRLCNKMKGTLTHNEFYNHINNIINFKGSTTRAEARTSK